AERGALAGELEAHARVAALLVQRAAGLGLLPAADGGDAVAGEAGLVGDAREAQHREAVAAGGRRVGERLAEVGGGLGEALELDERLGAPPPEVAVARAIV